MGTENGSLDVKNTQNKTWFESMLENRNPHAEADQRALLNTIKVVDTTSLSKEIQNASRDSAQKVGSRMLSLGDGSKLQMTTLPNGIIDMLQIKKNHKKALTSETYNLLSYYIIDTVSNKAFDVSQLWKNMNVTLSKPPAVLVIPDIQEILLVPTKDGEIILLGTYKPTQHLTLDDVYHSKRTGIMHEIAHHIQSKQRPSELSFNQMLLQEKLAFLFKWKSLVDAIFSRRSPAEKQTNTLLRMQAREHRVWEERNAHAFTLALTKKLRALGIDIFRGMSVHDIIQSEDNLLMSYDSSKLLETDRPLSALASQQYRKIRRSMKTVLSSGGKIPDISDDELL